MGTPSSTVSWWQYSQWVYNISRNMKMTEPTGADLSFLASFLWVIGDPNNPNATRPWLKEKFLRASVAAKASYSFDLATEPTHVLVNLLGVVGKDFKKIPITDFEAFGVVILISLTNNRRYGTTPYYGSVGGSLVTIP